MKSNSAARKIPTFKAYKTRNTRNVRRWQNMQDVPIKVDKCHLEQIINDIDNENYQNHREKLMKTFGPSVGEVLNVCSFPSLESLHYSPSSSILSYSITTLFLQLRKSLLNHDWIFFSHFLQILVQSKLVNTRAMILMIRSCLLILSNHDICYKDLKKFLSESLRFDSDSVIHEFINSIFTIPQK